MSDDYLQKVLMGKSERIYRQFVDNSGVLVDPTSPWVVIYDADGTEFDSGTPIKETTGVYYHLVTLTTANATIEGIYQAYWSATITGIPVSMDIPQYFYVTRIPWQATQPDNIINTIRRLTGDTNPESYRIGTEDMFYYLKDAVAEVEAEYQFGYTLTVTPTSMTWNQTLYSTPFVLFKLKTLILILESTLNENLYEAGSVKIGDIQIDVTSILKIRMENLKRVKKDYYDLLYSVKMNNVNGFIVDTYLTGRINNTNNGESIAYE